MRKNTRLHMLVSAFFIFGCVAVFIIYCLNATVFGKHLSKDSVPAESSVVVSELSGESFAARPEEKIHEPAVSQKKIVLPWELLLVNYENKLSEDYEFDLISVGSESVDSRIYEQLNSMLIAARDQGLSLWVASAYRSVATQKVILANEIELDMGRYNMTEEEATENALKTIAQPGCSEHHTGLAVDFNYVNDAFEDTAEYRWLSENAAEYGFVQRFPSGKEKITNISVEPWHYRYVGIENAKAMNRLGYCLEEYIEYLQTKQGTNAEN